MAPDENPLEPRVHSLETQVGEIKTDISVLGDKLSKGFVALRGEITDLIKGQAGIGQVSGSQIIGILAIILLISGLFVTYVNLGLQRADAEHQILHKELEKIDEMAKYHRAETGSIVEDNERLYQYTVDQNQAQWMMIDQLWQKAGNPPLSVVMDSWPTPNSMSRED